MKKLIFCLLCLSSLAQAESCYKSDMALEQLTQCAGTGDVTAQFDLGVMYYHGVGGVAQDFGKAAMWYSKAADQGHAGAQNNLGLMYDRSLGVPQDYVVSYIWLSLAALQNYDRAAINKDIIKKKLTPEQIASGDKIINFWLKKHSQENSMEGK